MIAPPVLATTPRSAERVAGCDDPDGAGDADIDLTWLIGDFFDVSFDPNARPDEAFSIERMADDVAAVMDAVEMPSAHVHGTWMGGLIAQDLAIRYPERVLSLVLGATYAGGPPQSRSAAPPTTPVGKGAGRSPARDGAVPVSDASPGDS